MEPVLKFVNVNKYYNRRGVCIGNWSQRQRQKHIAAYGKQAD